MTDPASAQPLSRALGLLSGPAGLLAVLLTVLVLALPGFFSLPPVDRDEVLFSQASRQMLETGDFIDIRFADQPRYKKPVGIYWMQAAAAAVTPGLVGDPSVSAPDPALTRNWSACP